MNTPENQLKNFNDASLDRATTAIVSDISNGRIPEDIFVQYFLPFFAGTIPTDEPTHHMEDWISVAGTPMNRVDVLGEDESVLFTVPPLFDTSIIDISRRERGEGLFSILQQFNLLNNNIPVVAENYLANALHGKFSTMGKDSDEFVSDSNAWDNIFSRYGIKPRSPVALPAPENPDDELEF